MKKGNRYDVSGLEEARFERGSRGQVLKNLLGIKNKREMDVVEQREQNRALEKLSRIYDRSHRFTAGDVCKIHKVWLSPIYPWAGKYRQVNLTKEGFTFASAAQIQKLMSGLENGPLREFTPCRFESIEEAIQAISIVHTELVLIHPFREGNGRVARLLAMLMSSQQDLPLLNFTGITGRKRREYFSAVRAGMDRNYKPMEDIFRSVIKKTLQVS